MAEVGVVEGEEAAAFDVGLGVGFDPDASFVEGFWGEGLGVVDGQAVLVKSGDGEFVADFDEGDVGQRAGLGVDEIAELGVLPFDSLFGV